MLIQHNTYGYKGKSPSRKIAYCLFSMKTQAQSMRLCFFKKERGKMIKKSFKKLNWKLLLGIFLTMFIPIIYRTARIYIAGTLDSSYSLSVAANLQWINVLFEVLEETFLLPLFFVFKRMFSNKDGNRRVTGRFYIISTIYIVLIVMFIILSKQLMEGFDVQNIDDTKLSFIRIEFVTRFFVMAVKIFTLMLIIKSQWKWLIGVIAINTGMNVLLDVFVVSHRSFSLDAGIIWLGYNQMISSAITSIILVVLILKIFKFKLNDFIHPIYKNPMKSWTESGLSFLESAVRNSFFIFFVIKVINKLDAGYSQGDFWVMNSFMWDWLLLPIIVISQYVNNIEAEDKKNSTFWERNTAPFILIAITVSIWFATIPTHSWFIKTIMNSNHSDIVSHLVLISIGFYVLFAFNNIIDKAFYGSGNAGYMLIQSLITNVIVFIPYYYTTDHMTIDDVAIMMGIAMAVDSALTFAMFGLWRYKARRKNTLEKVKVQ